MNVKHFLDQVIHIQWFVPSLFGFVEESDTKERCERRAGREKIYTLINDPLILCEKGQEMIYVC